MDNRKVILIILGFLLSIIILSVICYFISYQENITVPKKNGQEKLNSKINLELPHKVKIDLEKDIIRKTETLNIKSLTFSNIEKDNLNNYKEQYASIINIIKNKYLDFNEKEWQISLNIFSEDYDGIMTLNYVIDNKILTNKSIVFTIEKNTITMITYINMDKDIDENELLERVKFFEANYFQTKKQMKDNEEFISDEVMYHYYYNIDTLLYIYQLYFYETFAGQKLINNSYVSEYIIEKPNLN